MLGSHEVLQVPLTCLVPWQPGLCAPVGPGCESAQTRTFPSGQGRSKVKVPEVPAQGTSVPGMGCSAGDDRTARVGAGAGVSSSGSDPHGAGCPTISAVAWELQGACPALCFPEVPLSPAVAPPSATDPLPAWSPPHFPPSHTRSPSPTQPPLHLCWCSPCPLGSPENAKPSPL